MAKELPHVSDHYRLLTADTPPARDDWLTADYLIRHGYAAGTLVKNHESPERFGALLSWDVLPKGHEYAAQIARDRNPWPKRGKLALAILTALASLAGIYSAMAG